MEGKLEIQLSSNRKDRNVMLYKIEEGTDCLSSNIIPQPSSDESPDFILVHTTHTTLSDWVQQHLKNMIFPAQKVATVLHSVQYPQYGVQYRVCTCPCVTAHHYMRVCPGILEINCFA